MRLARHSLESLLVSIALFNRGCTEATGYGSYDASPTRTTTSNALTFGSSAFTTSSTGSATHTVQVGPKSSPHAYVPHSLTANVGDVVVFEFYPTNHSVVKADFEAPCVPANEGIFFSGMFDSFNEKDGQLVGPPPTWSVVVNDTQPTFFYCTAIGSCLENGMVGVINPNSTQTFDEQYKKALTYPYMLVPGQSMPAEGGGSTSGDPTSATASATTSSASASGGGGGGLSGGAIAGIVVAGVAFVAILVALFFVLGRNHVYSQWMSSQDGRTERTARWAFFNSAGSSSGNRKNELNSDTAKPPGTDITSVGSPDHMMGQFSPGPESFSGFGGSSPHQHSGQWNWDIPPNSQNIHGPMELEAAMIYQLPERRGS